MSLRPERVFEPPGDPEAFVVKFLLADAMIAPEQVERARLVQERLGRDGGLVDILVELGMVEKPAVWDCIRRHREKIPLGALLVLRGLVQRADLDRALALQRAGDRRRLGEILVAANAISARKLCLALSEQKGIPFVEPTADMVDLAVLRKLTGLALPVQEVVPLSLDGTGLHAVVPDPDRADLRNALQEALGVPVHFSVGDPVTLRACLRDAAVRARGGGEIRRIAIQGPDGNWITDAAGDLPAGDGAGRGAVAADAVRLVDEILVRALREGASDIHLEPLEDRMRARYRIDGALVHRTDLPRELGGRVCARMKVLAGMDVSNRRIHQDGRIRVQFSGRQIDLRVSSYVSLHGENLVLRVLDRKPTLLSMEDLGMAPRILEQYEQHALDLPTGVVLVTGPTGSGKTTTLYASIDRVNSPDIKIISAEDPVEFAIPGIVQCPINPKAGVDFASTLRSMVRQDPDIIVVGEIRDVETAEMAIQAALTGHKVFSTFHSEDTVGSLVRLVNMNIETFLIASTVVAVVAQRLVRRLCPHCREPSRPGSRILSSLGVDPDYFDDFPIFFGRGCMHCMDTGFRGRVGIYECLFLNQRVRDAILERAPSHKIREIATESTNLVSMLEDGLVKAALGHTTPEEVMRHAPRSGRPRSLTTLMELGGWPAGGKA